MIFIRGNLILGALSLCGGIALAQDVSKRPPPAPSLITANQVMSWLPADTETVIGLNGPFPFPGPEGTPDTRDAEPSATESEVRAIVDLPLFLFQLRSGGLAHTLEGNKAALAIEGSRHFRPPAVIGPMRYEGCTVVVFDAGAPIESDTFMKSAAGSAKRFDKIAGVTVAVFEEEVENDVWTTFVAFPRKNVVTVASNADYLRTVLTRMSGTPGPRALPASLPEWRHVDTSASMWGVRHYNRSEARFDPTSPFQGRHAANVPDASAIGLGFFMESLNPREAILTYLSGDKEARRVLENYIGGATADSASPQEGRIRFREPAPGVVQASISLSTPDAVPALLFGLSAMLGHAIYV
jgi:hypothetical protein